ncbi:hypothetical protein HY478_03490, partial [Candidatus Uhrbacteria bacterium]|nr:hypothetical protein [Candidatus Uhrbacteria bacterium]
MEYFAHVTSQTAEQVLSELKTSAEGLTAAEAQRRIRTHGPNEIAARAANWFFILQRQFASSFIYLL